MVSSKYGGNRGGGGGGGGGRPPYGIMLLLAFGAAVFGVMVLHKFREKRIFNILIKDKDTHIITLQLLLQKEKDYTKEMKKKIEEMKAKAYSLRTQKIELNNKIMDMQSLTVSLKEEGKALESELEDKGNEIKMLKEKEINSSIENSQVAALTELLKQKEAEIEDMKRLLRLDQNPVNVSTDDPSKPDVNLSAKVINEVAKSIEEGEKDVNAKDGEALTAKSEDGNENATEGAAKSEVQEGKRETEGSRDGGNGTEVKNAEEVKDNRDVSGDTKLEKSEDSQNDGGSNTSGEKGNRNETGVVESSRDDDVLKSMDEDAHKKPLDNSQQEQGQVLGMVSGDGMKMEVGDGSANVVSNRESSGKNGYRSKTMKKRWRKIFKNRDLEKTLNSEKGEGEVEKNESDTSDEGLRTGTDTTDDQVGLEAKVDSEVSTEGKLEHAENSGAGEGLIKPIGENGGNPGIEETNVDSNEEIASADGEDSVQQKFDLVVKQKSEDHDQNGVHEAVGEELPGTRPVLVLKKQRLPKVTKSRKIRKLPVLTN